MDSWQPLLTGVMADRAWEFLDRISRSLTNACENPWRWGAELRQPHSLAFGSAGMALFFSYLANASADEGCRQSATRFIRASLLATWHEDMQNGFESGTTGICWAAEHIKNSVDLDGGERALLEQWEPRLLHWCQTPDISPALVDGLAGLCAYAGERAQNGVHSQIAQSAWSRLKDLAELTGQGATWHVSGAAKGELLTFYPGLSFARRRYSMSVGYGVAGIVGALLATYTSGVCEPELIWLIESSVSWMLASRSSPDFHQSFPVIVGIEMPLISNGWYLGDLGVIAVILNAAYVFGRDDWKRAVLEIALRRAQCPPTFYIHNLLYGSVGRAHFCNRVFHLTGDQRFFEAAVQWYSLALGFRDPHGAMGGTLNNGQQFQGLFWGIAGLGLGLLGAVSSVEPAWDRIFFGSCRQPAIDYLRASA
jgi:lantibiotic biosynthesis protein